MPAPGRVSLYKAGGLTDIRDEGIYTCNISGNTVYAGIYTVQNYNDGMYVQYTLCVCVCISNVNSDDVDSQIFHYSLVYTYCLD